MMHAFAEILAHFKLHNHTNLEAAQQATYDLGYARGVEDTKAAFAADVGDSTPAASTRELSDE
jgi:hypothetical protein